jgi:hypothetical protein
MLHVICPPARPPKSQRAPRSLYLAGDFADAGWRDAVAAALGDLDLDLFDPRDGVWGTPAAADLDAVAYRMAVDWQVRMALEATVVLFWLPGDPPPLALLQLGQLAAKRGGAAKGRTVVVARPTAPPRDPVVAFATQLLVGRASDLEDALRLVRHALK